MEETILQNDLVREALDYYCDYLEKKEKRKFSQAMRSVIGEYYEKHIAEFHWAYDKLKEVSTFFLYDKEIDFNHGLIREALGLYCKHLLKTANLELKKAMRAVDGEMVEYHNAVSLRCQEKFNKIQDLCEFK